MPKSCQFSQARRFGTKARYLGPALWFSTLTVSPLGSPSTQSRCHQTLSPPSGTSHVHLPQGSGRVHLVPNILWENISSSPAGSQPLMTSPLCVAYTLALASAHSPSHADPLKSTGRAPDLPFLLPTIWPASLGQIQVPIHKSPPGLALFFQKYPGAAWRRLLRDKYTVQFPGKLFSGPL